MQINLFRHCETLLILKPSFGDDCFIRYLFSDEGNENIVLDFINGVMIDLNFQTFNNVVILNPFNLTKYLDGKESIVDVPKGRRAKCITEDNQTVIHLTSTIDSLPSKYLVKLKGFKITTLLKV